MLAANAKLFRHRKYPVLLARVAYGYQCHVTQSVTKCITTLEWECIS